MPQNALQTSIPLPTLPQASEAAEFYAILFHDDRKSNAVLATRRKGLWTEESLPCSQLPYLRSSFADSNDHYVTVNGFAGKRRDLNRCRQINAIMFDIDAHNESSALAVRTLKSALNSSIKSGKVPAPNIVVDTGRGLQVYYVLDKSIPYRLKSGSVNSSVIDFLADVRQMLATLIELAVVAQSTGCELDKSVFDLTRVARIPGSYNGAAGRRAQLISTSRDYWTLNSLKTACSLQPNSTKVKAGKTHSARVYKYDRLQMMRMAKVEQLVAYREANGGCNGTRDLCLFIYYNAATQVVEPQEALTRTLRLNQTLASPLPTQDVEQIARTVDNVVICHGAHKGKKGFYPLTKESIIAKLQLTAQEMEATNFFASKRQTTREAAKQATKAKRAQRDAKICKLYGNGLTQKQVAAKTSCSLGTVCKVTKAAKITRGCIKDKLKAQFKAALATKTKQQEAKATSKVSFYWHTSWGCAAPLALPYASELQRPAASTSTGLLTFPLLQ